MQNPIGQRPSQSTSFVSTLVTSAVGGGVGGYLCFPPEGIKKRIQSGNLNKTDFFPRNLTNGRVISILHPRELFRGSGAFSVAVMTATTASMTFNNLMKTHPSYDSSSKTWNGALAVNSGMLGAIIGSTPVENTILTQQLHKLGPIPALRHMFKSGISRPWVGVRELMVREAGFAGVMLFAGPEAHRAVASATNNNNLAFGAEVITGVAGAYLTHPADCVATYRQKVDGKIALKEAIQIMYKEEGTAAFFKGAAFRSLLFTGCSVIIPRATKLTREILNNE